MTKAQTSGWMKNRLVKACQAKFAQMKTRSSSRSVRAIPPRLRGPRYGDRRAGTSRARPRGPGLRKVVEQARQVAAGLGGHRPADPVVELGLVEPAVGVVLAEELSDRVALGVGDPDVLVGVADAARPLLRG